MPFLKVYVHFVWSTKNRVPYLRTREIRNLLWRHILVNARAKGIHIDFVNGYTDHCHCLVSLGFDKTISEVMQLIKGESAFWLNTKIKLPKELGEFEWQDEYYAASVSISALDRVRNYIKNQEQHHNKRTTEEEFNDFIFKNGFEKLKDSSS